jgi:hypothetical protein
MGWIQLPVNWLARQPVDALLAMGFALVCPLPAMITLARDRPMAPAPAPAEASATAGGSARWI